MFSIQNKCHPPCRHISWSINVWAILNLTYLFEEAHLWLSRGRWLLKVIIHSMSQFLWRRYGNDFIRVKKIEIIEMGRLAQSILGAANLLFFFIHPKASRIADGSCRKLSTWRQMIDFMLILFFLTKISHSK